MSTARDGTAGLRALLRRYDVLVNDQRGKLGDAYLDPSVTFVLLDPGSLSGDDQALIKRFVEAGGRLVAGGANARWVDGIVDDDPPRWSDEKVTGPVAFDGEAFEIDATGAVPVAEEHR